MYPSNDLVAVLKGIPWFHDLNPEILGKVARISDVREIPKGQDLFLEGGKEDYLYIVLDGQFSLDIHVPNCGRSEVYKADPLDVVGWSSMTSVIRQRTCSARADVDSRVLAIDGPGLQKLCDEYPYLGYVVMRRIANVAASRLLTTRIQLLVRLAGLTSSTTIPLPGFEHN